MQNDEDTALEKDSFELLNFFYWSTYGSITEFGSGIDFLGLLRQLERSGKS